MRVVATRSSGVGVLYVITGIIGLLFLFFGSHEIYYLIIGLVLTLISFFIVIDYFRTPGIPIMINEQNELILHDGIIIKPDEILDVSYRKATARGLQYHWGKVTIKTKKETYIYGYINDCEDVCMDITKIMYQHKDVSKLD
ncbi:Uncharacterised protein [Acholeplasma oculi]|nr:hypothetical protein [Acholeplasma oculi]SKC43463.1 hypothetical protein SAMN02745122_0982 [Acholeplasma oculi]SUT88678.1 Uncharacterised protein [Acholeplasma oculi]